MTKKDKNKYGLHPYEVGIKKNKDGSSTSKDKSYQTGPCVFPYQLEGESKKNYRCFPDEKLGTDVCPTSLHKKTKKIKTVGVCYDLKKLNCVIAPEHKSDAKKTSKKSSKKDKKRFCSGINFWCTGGFPTMNSPPQDPVDMNDNYEFLRQQSGYAAFFTNPDGTCLFHAIAGSIICDPELGIEFLKEKIQFMEANFLSKKKKISGSNYGEILRNCYIALMKARDINEVASHIFTVINVGDIKEFKEALDKVLEKITDEHIQNLRDRQNSKGFMTDDEMISLDDENKKKNYLTVIAAHFSINETRFELVDEDTTILNYMRDKFLEKVKDKSVYTEEPMGRELCKTLNINLKRHTVYKNENQDLVYHMEEEENKPSDCDTLNIYYNGENHFEFMVKLDYIDILPDILLFEESSESDSSSKGNKSKKAEKAKKQAEKGKKKAEKAKKKAEKAKKQAEKGKKTKKAKKSKRGSMSN